MPEQSQNKIERRILPATITIEDRADGKKGTVRGIPIVYNSWSNDLGWFRERIMPGAATNALKRSNPVLLLNHDSMQLLGKLSSGTLRHEEKQDGVHIEADIPTSRADVRELLDRGDISTMSFAFTTKRDEWIKKTGDLDERIIHEFDEIYDYSLITVGEAYSDTSVALRSRDEALKEENTEENDWKVQHEARKRKLTFIK